MDRSDDRARARARKGDYVADIERLAQAASVVQDVAYELAKQVDHTSTTELMVTSRKLERLVERLTAQLGAGAQVTWLAKEDEPDPDG